ncbi:MAG: hypothetical protein RL181_1991 [Bacteroidota bacterium]
MKTNMRLHHCKTLFIACSLSALVGGCVEAERTYSTLPPGVWRGVLKLVQVPVTPNPKGEPLPDKVNLKFEEVTAGELPFTFEVKYATPDSFYIELRNGEERILLSDISFGRNPATGQDTFLFRFPVYQAYLKGVFSENVLEGEWVDLTRDDYRIPFLARHGRAHRFTTLKKEPIADISGKWETYFETDTDKPYPAIGEFRQKGNYLEGTFLTETGDYRFLEGTVQGNKAYLSAFDGAHAFLFEAKILDDGSMIGGFRSGHRYQCAWEAKRNPDFTLRDPHALTLLKPGFSTFSFRFKNPEGREVTLDDPAFQGKVKIVQVMGTWCPNCRDESDFLVEYLRENPSDQLAVVALAFERFKDEARAMQQLKDYQKSMGIPYPILYAGPSDKKEAAKALPMLESVVAFPTLILLDKSNRVRKIHTGYSGPATSGYAAFKEDFSRSVQELLGE